MDELFHQGQLVHVLLPEMLFVLIRCLDLTVLGAASRKDFILLFRKT